MTDKDSNTTEETDVTKQLLYTGIILDPDSTAFDVWENLHTRLIKTRGIIQSIRFNPSFEEYEQNAFWAMEDLITEAEALAVQLREKHLEETLEVQS